MRWSPIARLKPRRQFMRGQKSMVENLETRLAPSVNITINSGPNTTPGVGGAHDVVFVATEQDSL